MVTRLAVIATAAVSLASAAVFQAAEAPQSEAELELLASGHPVTTLTVADRGPYRFIVDTAATRTSLLQGFREAHGPVSDGAAMSIAGATGAAQVRLATLESLQVAGRTFERLEAYNLPEGPVDALGVDGVLGADVLKGFVLEMDPGARRWSLQTAHSPEGDLSYKPFDLDEGDTPLTTVSIQGRDFIAAIDTGAQATIMNAAAAAALALSRTDPTAREERPARGTSHGSTESWSVCLPAFSYDGRGPEAVRMRVADLPIFAALGFADQPALILGYDHLGRGRIVIDYPARRIGFDRTSPAAPC